MNEVCIREYGLLIQEADDDAPQDLRLGRIVSPEAWAFLEELELSSDENHRFIETAKFAGRKALRVLNFVGVISTPDGTQIEILPKISEDLQGVEDSRELLWKMLGYVEDLNHLETTDAMLMVRNRPFIEALIAIFLEKCTTLIRHGIRRDYERIEAEEPFLRGRLHQTRQLRQPPGRDHLFQIEYDLFSENRAENRLLHSAITRVLQWSESESNQRLARELRGALGRVPLSFSYANDFQQWRTSRDLVHYQPLLSWIRLILHTQTPFALKGQDSGISLLFPMEQLFERYVARVLRTRLMVHGLEMATQLQEYYLCLNPETFLLKPDMGVRRGGAIISILDTKWKLIDQGTTYDNGKIDHKAGVSQSDIYQLFAYGHRYLAGTGPMALIYPKSSRFSTPVPPFDLGNGLSLNVLPYDLDKDECPGLASLLGIPEDVLATQ